MAQYFFGITREEKENILNQHKTIYDGYVTQYGQNNEQPLYVQDFANDKNGITVSNKGNVKTYTNMNINESHSGLDMIGDGEDDLINGTLNFNDETHWEDEDIEFISLGLDNECKHCDGDNLDVVIDIDDIELGEGFDDFSMKKRYDDYSRENFRKFPKVFRAGMEDPEGTMLMGNEDEDFDNFVTSDDDFDPIYEDEFSNEVDEDILPELTQKLNESLDMFRRFKNY
jgi:hypothetical protein